VLSNNVAADGVVFEYGWWRFQSMAVDAKNESVLPVQKARDVGTLALNDIESAKPLQLEIAQPQSSVAEAVEQLAELRMKVSDGKPGLFDTSLACFFLDFHKVAKGRKKAVLDAISSGKHLRELCDMLSECTSPAAFLQLKGQGMFPENEREVVKKAEEVFDAAKELTYYNRNRASREELFSKAVDFAKAVEENKAGLDAIDKRMHGLAGLFVEVSNAYLARLVAKHSSGSRAPGILTERFTGNKESADLLKRNLLFVGKDQQSAEKDAAMVFGGTEGCRITTEKVFTKLCGDVILKANDAMQFAASQILAMTFALLCAVLFRRQIMSLAGTGFGLMPAIAG
jgi:hypothetical protein